jgi:Mg2+ and Co2+ transporter CorA
LLFAYRGKDGRLERLEPDAPQTEAIWIDLYQPPAEEAAAVHAALGVEVPTLADMEEIEISNRFYHVGEIDYMTVVLPGAQPDSTQVMPQHIRPHAFIPAAGALTDTSIDELVRSALGVPLAFHG